MTLTSRLVGEYSQLHEKPFTTYEGLYRRLNQLKDAGLLNRRAMLWSGEFYYYLTKRGAAMLESDSFPDVPTRALNPVAEALQRHEFELSRFWIKALRDAKTLGFEVCQFWRDGEFIIPHERGGRKRFHMPDGGFLIDDGNRKRFFLLEIDRSTQMAMGTRPSRRSFHAKLEIYLDARSKVLKHEDLIAYELAGFRLLVVCRSEERLKSLACIAEQLGIRTLVAFTCLPRFIDVQDQTAKGWRYRPVNLFTSSLFSFPNRSPPSALLPKPEPIQPGSYS